MNSLKNFPWLHPFLFAAFPVVFVYAENINDVAFKQVWSILFGALLFAAIVLFLSRVVLRNFYKSAVFTTIFLLLFLLYRPFYTVLQKPAILDSLLLNRHRVLVPLFLGILFYIFYRVFRTPKPLFKVTQVFTVTGLLLLAPSVGKIGWHLIQNKTQKAELPHQNAPEKPLPEVSYKPDIYYFVLDSYGRQDILKKVFNYNNTAFINALKQRGFYIADSSVSNYWQTRLSVASALNMNYLPAVPGLPDAASKNTKPLENLISNNAVRSTLKNLGYKFAAFATNYNYTEIKNADVYLKPRIWFELNEFKIAILNLTPFPDLFQLYYRKNLVYETHRTILNYPFQKMLKPLKVQSPKFVFLHSLLLHPPFLTGKNGAAIFPNRAFTFADGDGFFTMHGTESEYLNGYINQLPVLNRKILQVIDSVMVHSKNPPVIILQGDHSSRVHLDNEAIDKTPHHEVFPVLNAYFFPETDSVSLYPGISPVNSFRVLLNTYFKANLPLLPDKCYYSTWLYPYKFTEVTAEVNKPHRINNKNKE